jgi:serine/threonine-protein kinase
MTLTLTASQRQQLTDWLAMNPTSQEFISTKQAKIILKAEYERLKTGIVRKLVATPEKKEIRLKAWAFKIYYYFIQVILRR